LPTVIEPDRAVCTLFPSTEYPTVPLPEPDPPDDTVMNSGLLLVAVQGHELLFVVTVNVPVPPVAATCTPTGLSVNEQVLDCVTVKVIPPAVIVPVRDAPVLFAVAEYWTVPLPAPDVPLVMVSHSGLFDIAVQVQDVVILNDPVAGLGPMFALVGVKL
jgi:hypothetical protein